MTEHGCGRCVYYSWQHAGNAGLGCLARGCLLRAIWHRLTCGGYKRTPAQVAEAIVAQAERAADDLDMYPGDRALLCSIIAKEIYLARAGKP